MAGISSPFAGTTDEAFATARVNVALILTLALALALAAFGPVLHSGLAQEADTD